MRRSLGSPGPPRRAVPSGGLRALLRGALLHGVLLRGVLLGGALFVAPCSGCAPTSPVARASLLVDAGRTEEAQRLLEEHLEHAPDDVEARRQLVRVLGHRGDLGAAEREAARLAARLGERDPTPWIELGHAYELAHRYDEALAFFDRGAAVAPQDPRGPRAGGLRAARWGELEWAAPRLEEALRRDPEDATTWHALGLVRVHQGRYMEAKGAYERGLRIAPHAPEHRVGLATLALRLDQPDEALAQYDALVALRPKDGDVQLGRAYALWRLGRRAEARHALERARALGANPAVREKLARVMNSGDVREGPTSGAEPAGEGDRAGNRVDSAGSVSSP